MNETSVVSGTDYASLLDEVAETMECPNIRVWISLFLDETLKKQNTKLAYSSTLF